MKAGIGHLGTGRNLSGYLGNRELPVTLVREFCLECGKFMALSCKSCSECRKAQG